MLNLLGKNRGSRLDRVLGTIDDVGEVKTDGRRKKEKFSWYELSGVPFTVYRFEDRDNMLKQFQGMVSSSDEGFLYTRVKEKYVAFDRYRYLTSDVKFFVGLSRSDDIFFFNAKKADNPLRDRPNVRKAFRTYVQLDDGKFARVFVAYRFPIFLPEGFLYSFFGLITEIVLKWEKVPSNKAMGIMDSTLTRKATLARTSMKARKDYENLVEMSKRIRAGADMVRFTLFFVLTAETLEELDKKSTTLTDNLKVYGVEVESVPYFQRELYEFKDSFGLFFGIERKYTDTYSIRAFFPLVSESLLEPDGVFLGLSGTGNPVVFDLYKRQNLLMLILGETGAGKSMTAKVFLRRMRLKYGSELELIGIDPENEYVPDKVCEMLGLNRVVVKENQDLGLDPVKLLLQSYERGEEGVEVGQIADVLGEVYGLPLQLKNALRREMYNDIVRGRRYDNLVDFIESLRGKDRRLYEYLSGALAPPDVHVFMGDPPEIGGSVVFGLKGMRSRSLKILVSALVSVWAYNRLFTMKMGERRRRVVTFVDEGWLFMDTPSIVNLFENIARRGRKHGLAFAFMTQRVEDVARVQVGRTLLEQAASAILLRQEREGVEMLREIYKLTQSEVGYLVTAPPGRGLLKAGDHRILLEVLPTEEEYKAFTTKPLE